MKLPLVALAMLAATPAAADPLRLRGDAVATTRSPAGLLVLDGEADRREWLSAEALVWLGSASDHGDALVIALRARGFHDRAEARLGRLVVTSGALRPLHLDGLAARVRLPYRVDIDSFAGMPVAPGADARSWDWAVGGRVGRRLGDWGGAGVAWLERRDAGRLAARELGIDAGGAAGRFDLSGKATLDAIDSGALASAAASAGTRLGPLGCEVVGTYRSPRHLLPATSLFSVLGDVPALHGSARLRWRAAPRLDVSGDAGATALDDSLYEQVAVRATLRLDDRGTGTVSAELRRTGAALGGWTGARLTARTPLAADFALASEVELVIPDEPRDRGTLWPWAMTSISWARGPWDATLALEASASPEHTERLDAIGRLGRRWGTP